MRTCYVKRQFLSSTEQLLYQESILNSQDLWSEGDWGGIISEIFVWSLLMTTISSNQHKPPNKRIFLEKHDDKKVDGILNLRVEFSIPSSWRLLKCIKGASESEFANK